MRTSGPPTYIHKHGENGYFYFRVALPRRLRHIVNKYEIRRSLKTKNYSLALKRARRLAVIAEEFFQRENVNEKELRDFLVTSSQIKMAGPVRIENGALECNGIETDPDKPEEEAKVIGKISEYLQLSKGTADQSVVLDKLVEKLLESNPSPESIIATIDKIIVGQNCSTVQSPENGNFKHPHRFSGKSIQEVRKEFVRSKIEAKDWTVKTAGENESIIKVFEGYFPDIAFDEITHSDVEEFRSALLQAPTNVTKSNKYKDMSLSQVINTKPAETLAVGSVNKYLRRISAMYNFAIIREFVTINPFSAKQLPEEEAPNEKRNVLTSKELAAIFNPDSFYAEADQAFKYWCPLIALYTGARQNEIASLKADDIQMVEGYLCFNFITLKQKRGKLVKRFVPIHPHLKSLGIEEYASNLAGQQLFPELKEKRDGYGEEVSRWYSKYRRSVGILDKRDLDFHSYRHTFVNALDDQGVKEKIISQIVGHSTQGPRVSTTRRVYLKKKDVEILVEAIAKLNFGEPVNNIQPFDALFL